MWISYTNCESHTQTYRPVGSFSTTSPTSASDFETTPKSIAKVKNWEREREREREREIAFKRKKERKENKLQTLSKKLFDFDVDQRTKKLLFIQRVSQLVDLGLDPGTGSDLRLEVQNWNVAVIVGERILHRKRLNAGGHGSFLAAL